MTTHSVIGTAHQSLTGDDGDCVVPASSARLPGTVSEIEVPATHPRVHHQPATVRELERILTQHLHETELEPRVETSAGPVTKPSLAGRWR